MDAYGSTGIVNKEFTAENALIEFATGNLPKRIELMNKSTGAVAIWNDTMADGQIMVLSAGGGAGGVGMKTSNGISLINGEADVDGQVKPLGFSLGALADFNDAAETLSMTITL